MRNISCFTYYLAGIFLSATPTGSFFLGRSTMTRSRQMTLSAREENTEETAKEENKSEIPLLPHFGSSSQSFFNPFDGTLPHLKPENQDPGIKEYVAARKMELQYTCNICDTRNCHKVSRIAYRKGVVIATCKGCKSQHLIADNLGFTNLWNEKEGTIEDYFANKGMEQTVSRVSKDIFDLEKTLGFDSSSGSIMGDDGKPALE